ncbi:hypothetical protein SOP31_001928 [Salmonella enterica]|uniref:hypothetical protein n=1 Tax=Salmonella enterica TaxID=28901 RepID=UPI0008FC7237|nr:hypothetical protein [Salmonella enterica]EAN3268558.1 hypothetical protein [Salmonella enterica subsp. enterica serovar Oranienburg]EAW3955081.1 hypothetical protein [Salmonella enterica subsp. enterica]ECO0838299.1 hypothetical protein [Salmonella enterica subsp. enterica serovar Newport]ECV5913552.1 hypothetical protein [Salmonella enterica subsp. enterica serovar Enteritidis]EDC0986722.1 hypothetical protein [Salmonella enterica subsp. enterica serovar Give]EDC9713334.1 hypothetical pr
MTSNSTDIQQEENIIDKLVVKYDGPALVDHKIDLDVLIESLNGLNSLLKEVNLVVNGTSENINVEVEPFSEGSFEYLIDIIQNPLDHLNILSIIGIGGTAALAAGNTLIELVRKINGRQIRRLTLTAEGDCKIIMDDGEEIIAPSYFRPLLASPSIRKSLSKLIHNPLQKEGYESLKISTQQGVELVNVHEDGIEPFRYRRVPVEQSLSERLIEETPITFLTIHKDKNTGWRVNYDDETISVSIEDNEFLQRVSTGRESGVFSDVYYVDLLIRENLNSLDKTYIVVTVHGIL